MTFFNIQLPAPYVGQIAYQSSAVSIIKIDDDVSNKTLQVFCQLGEDASFKYWVPVMSGDSYTVDWTNSQISDAVMAYFGNA